MILNLFVVLVVLVISLYTFNFARWAAKAKNWRGATGLYILTAITFFLPLWLLFFRS